MNENKEALNRLSRNLANRMLKKDSTGWPPVCTVFAYQPVRPQMRKTGEVESTPFKGNPKSNDNKV